MNPLTVDQLILNFLNEDLGTNGDLSTQNLFGKRGRAVLIAKEGGVLCGKPFFERTFTLLNEKVTFKWNVSEGERVEKGQVLCEISGDLGAILSAERTALNLIQKLSGIATETRKYAEALKGSSIKLLDTRKTTPGMRVFEKYATRIGGATNHRFGLYDAVMIKDNHIKAYGSIKRALTEILKTVPATAKVEVEVENWEQLEETIEVIDLIDIVMLDNWKREEIGKGARKLKKAKQSVKVEVSGGVTLESLRYLKNEPIDYVSTSRIITQAKWLDFSLEVL